MKHLKHCETSWNSRHSIRRYRRSMWRRLRSMWRGPWSRGVTGDIGDCGVGITPQMCNRVTNHGDMVTFSRPELLWMRNRLWMRKTILWGEMHFNIIFTLKMNYCEYIIVLIIFIEKMLELLVAMKPIRTTILTFLKK